MTPSQVAATFIRRNPQLAHHADDIFQECQIAAWEAQKSFNGRKGSQLSTWIHWQCRGAISKYLCRIRAHQKTDSTDELNKHIEEDNEAKIFLAHRVNAAMRADEIYETFEYEKVRRLMYREISKVFSHGKYDTKLIFDVLNAVMCGMAYRDVYKNYGVNQKTLALYKSKLPAILKALNDLREAATP